MAEAQTWFITGTSSGIGLQLVRQLIPSSSNIIIASCRDPTTADDLNALKSHSNAGNLHIIQLDVTDEQSIKAAAKSASEILGDKGLDYLINNAGINTGEDGAFDLELKNLVACLQSNVFGPALIAQAFLPLLEKGRRKVIVNFTSGLASHGLDLGPKCAAYSISKTALNMLTYKQAKERPDLIAFVVDPGWVKTRMGGEGAFLELHESATPLLELFQSATPQHSGKFFNYRGEVVPW